MINVPEIRDQVLRYLSSQITLSELDDWLTERSWNMHLDSSLDAQRFAASVELWLAEYSKGHLSPEELQKALTDLVHVFEPVSVAI
jgi:hypothetical protein